MTHHFRWFSIIARLVWHAYNVAASSWSNYKSTLTGHLLMSSIKNVEVHQKNVWKWQRRFLLNPLSGACFEKERKKRFRERSKGKADLPFSPSVISFSSDQNKWPKENTMGILCPQKQMLLKFSRKHCLKRLKQNCPSAFQTIVFHILTPFNWLYRYIIGQGEP